MLIFTIKVSNNALLGLVALLWVTPESRIIKTEVEGEPEVCSENDESDVCVADEMPLDQGTLVYIADDTKFGRKGYVVSRLGGPSSGSAMYVCVFAGELLEKVNYRAGNVYTNPKDAKGVDFGDYNMPNMQHMEDKARRRFGDEIAGADGGLGLGTKSRDASPSPSRRRPGSGRPRGKMATLVTMFLDLWGLRWTRRRVGVAGAMVVAGYRGWRWFGLKDRVLYMWEWLRDEAVGVLEEFGFDEEWRVWAFSVLQDKETWKTFGFGLFMLLLAILFITDGSVSADGIRNWVCGGDEDQADDGSQGGSTVKTLLEENNRLLKKIEDMEECKKESQGDCVVAGIDCSSNLDALRQRLEEHKKVAAEDSGLKPRDRKKEDDIDEFDAPESQQDVNKLIHRLDREMQNPSEQFFRSLKSYKVMDDWSLPAGARQRLGPTFLGETVYKGGRTARQWWTTFMAEHGIMECPAAQDGLSAAIALDYLLLVDKQDVVNSSGAETLARELYGLCKCFEDCTCKDDWRQPRGAKNWSTKAKWSLRNRYSVRALMAGKVHAPAADAEVRKTMETEALFEKYLTKSGTDNYAPTMIAIGAGDSTAAVPNA